MQEMNFERSVLDRDMDLLMGVINEHGVPASLARRLLAHVYLRHNRCKLTDIDSMVPHQLFIDCCEQFNKLLTSHHLFATANSGYVNMLIGNMQELILLPGDVLYQAGQPAQDMYFVRKGAFVCVHFKNEGDNEGEITETYDEGGAFGVVGVLIEMLRQDTVLADEFEEQASVCASLSRDAIEDPLEVYPEQAEVLHKERQKALAALFSKHKFDMETALGRIFSQRKEIQLGEGKDENEPSSPRDGVYDHTGVCIGLGVEQLHSLLLSLRIVVTFHEAEIILAEGDMEERGYWTQEQARSILLRNAGSGNASPRKVFRRVSSTANQGPARFGIRSVSSSRKGSKVGPFDPPGSNAFESVGPISASVSFPGGPRSPVKSMLRRASASFASSSRRASLAAQVPDSSSLTGLKSDVSAKLGLPAPEESPLRSSTGTEISIQAHRST
jgi:hypothetical protein